MVDINKIKPNNITTVTGITMLLYGKAGMGKSTFASKFPKPLLLNIEGTASFILGANLLNIDYISDAEIELGVTDSKEKENVIGLFEVLKQFFVSDYETLILDGVNPLINMFKNKTCKTMGRANIRQHKYGDTYDDMREEFTKTVNKLISRGKNIVFITHEESEEEINESEDIVINKIIPFIKDKELKTTLPALVDNIGYVYVSKDNKFMVDFSPFGKEMGKNRFGISEPIEAEYNTFKNLVEEHLKKNNKTGGNK